MKVDRLDDGEVDQVRGRAPSLEETLDAASGELRELVRNPFNLRLLCELLAMSGDRTALTRVRTQIELLDRYWEARVGEPVDRDTRSLNLGRLVEELVRARSLGLSRPRVVEITGDARTALGGLLSDGVLIESAPLGLVSPEPVVSFSHNILFDYAVARLWLRELQEETIARLARSDDEDLVLAIRPGIVFAFQRQWYTEEDHRSFWERATAFVGSQMPLVGKIIAAGVAAEEYRRLSDVVRLLERVERSDAPAIAILRRCITAALTNFDADPTGRPLWGENAPEWLALARELSMLPLEKTAWHVRGLLAPLTAKAPQLTPEQSRQANEAARRLLPHCLADDRFRPIVPVALAVAALTVATAPEDTEAVLRLLLRPEEIAAWGHEYLRVLAERLPRLVESSPTLAVDVVDAAFTATGSREETVPSGSRILPLVFNKHDMLEVTRHVIAEAYPQVMSASPVIATEIMLAVMTATVAQERLHLDETARATSFTLLGRAAVLKPDRSQIWTAGSYVDRYEWWKILQAFSEGLKKLGLGGNTRELRAVLVTLAERNELAVVWNQVLVAGAEEPLGLGCLLVDLLRAPGVLGCTDTRVAAGNLIAALYPHLSESDRRDIELAIMRVPEEFPEGAEDYGRKTRDQLVGCVPPDLVATEEVRAARAGLQEEGGPPKNAPDFSVAVWTPTEEESLRDEGIDVAESRNAELWTLVQRARGFAHANAPVDIAAEETAGILAALARVRHWTDAADGCGAEQHLVEQASDYALSCYRRLALAAGLTRDHPAFGETRGALLKGSRSPKPEQHPEDEKRWDERGPSWGSPSPRVDAAEGLLALAARPETVDSAILTEVERLAADPVPPVRFQVLTRANWLYKTAPDLMWRLLDRCAGSEQKLTILDFVVTSVLLRLPRSDDSRVEPLVREIYRRTRRREHSERLRGACARFYMLRAVWLDDRRGNRYVATYATRPLEYEPEVTELIGFCRGLLRFEGESLAPEERVRVRRRAFAFLREVLESVLEEARALRARHPGLVLNEWPAESIARERMVHQLAHQIAMELSFASGERDEHDAADDHEDIADRERFLEEAASLLEDFCEVEFVETAHDVLKTLRFLIPADPRRVFLLIGRLIRRAEQDGVQYEPLAADVLVDIVERYLAEYRALLREDSDVRASLISALDVFVEAGWPRAFRLTYRLDEVFR